MTRAAERAAALRFLEVLLAFAKLGVSAFGGPIAHLGYFREEFVARRRWLDEHAYADLVSLCQFLPGPASSQVGFSLGLLRAGYAGGIAAWVGFTLPSAVLLVAFASMASVFAGPSGSALLHGLKLVAVAIVAQAVWSMARSLCPDWQRALMAVAAVGLLLVVPSPVTQIAVIVGGALLGLWCCRSAQRPDSVGYLPPLVSRRAGWVALTIFFLLLVSLPLFRRLSPESPIALVESFYRSGALVFGGGHVVLPLLDEALVSPGWVSRDTFLAGYGAAQAVPGPLFTFAAYLGSVAAPAPGIVSGAALGLLGIFLPGLLILMGVLPFWEALRQRAGARAVMAGVNAAVVGLLAAALWAPVWTGAVRGWRDGLLAGGGFLLLALWRLRPILVVALIVASAWLLAHVG